MSDESIDGNPLAGVTGVALAGGRSTRMGSDKATLALAGEPLVARVIAQLRRAFTTVMVIGPANLEPLIPHTHVIPDDKPGLGPLGALLTALRAVETEWVFLAACDMPFLQPALARFIGELALATPNIDVVAPRSSVGLEPLSAAYRRDLAPLAAQTLDGPRSSMRELLSQARVLEVSPTEVAQLDPRGISTFNANTPEEWRRAEALAHELGRADR